MEHNPYVIDGSKVSNNEKYPSFYQETLSTLTNLVWSISSSNSNIIFSAFQDINFATDIDSSPIIKPCLIVGYNDGFSIWDLGQIDSKMHSISLVCSQHTEFPASIVRVIDNIKVHGEIIVAVVQEHRKHHQVVFISLIKNEIIHQISFKEKISDIQFNEAHFVVGLKASHQLVVFDFKTFENVKILECWKDELLSDLGPIFSLGSKFIAYQPKIPSKCYPPLKTKKVQTPSESNQFDLKKKIQDIGGKIITTNTNDVKRVFQKVVLGSTQIAKIVGHKYKEGDYSISLQHNEAAGYIEILSLKDDYVQNFKAYNDCIVYMKFDPSGYLLLTSPNGGQIINIWSTFFHELKPSPLYDLDIGMMTRQLSSIHFNDTGTIVTILTTKGTVHIFPILPHGGPITSPEDHSLDFIKFNEITFNNQPPRIATLSAQNSLCVLSYSFPLKKKWEADKIDKKRYNQCCLVFDSNGVLTKNVIEIPSNEFKGKCYAHYRWNLIGSIKPTHFISPKSIKSQGQNLNSGIETTTHNPVKGSFLDDYAINMYLELPVNDKEYIDSQFDHTPKKSIEPKNNFVDSFNGIDSDTEESNDESNDDEFLIVLSNSGQF